MSAQPTYRGLFINLDRSVDRRAQMEAQLKKFNLQERYSRFPAVDGQTLTGTSGPISAGEYACYQSHYQALESVRTTSGTIHIMEDDVELSPQLEQVINAFDASGQLDSFDLIFTDTGIPWDVSLLRTYKQLYDLYWRSQPPQVTLLDLSGAYRWGTESYLVPRRSLDKMLDVLRRGIDSSRLPFDLFMRQEAQNGRLRIGCIFPFITGARVSEVRLTTITGRSEETVLSREIIALLRFSFFIGRDLANLPPLLLEKLHAHDDDDQNKLIAAVLGFVVSSREFSTF